MASGTLGQSALSAATYTVIYTVPSSIVATVGINIVNRSGTTDAIVRIAISSTSDVNNIPSTEEFIEYDTTISINDVLERTGIVVGANKKIIAYSNTANTSVNVFGFEEGL